MFRISVAKSRSGCCKNRSECCTCCNDYTHMFQVYVSNISLLQVFSSGCCICMHVASVFFKWFQVVHTSVARVSSRMFSYVFNGFQVFQIHVSSVSFVCCNCCILDVSKVDR
jgi:hypothetical protein